ncbi:hypothetical protein D3C72_2379990 [compost metagenome]
MFVAVAADLPVDVLATFPDAVAIGEGLAGEQGEGQGKAGQQWPFHSLAVEE